MAAARQSSSIVRPWYLGDSPLDSEAGSDPPPSRETRTDGAPHISRRCHRDRRSGDRSATERRSAVADGRVSALAYRPPFRRPATWHGGRCPSTLTVTHSAGTASPRVTHGYASWRDPWRSAQSRAIRPGTRRAARIPGSLHRRRVVADRDAGAFQRVRRPRRDPGPDTRHAKQRTRRTHRRDLEIGRAHV